MRYILASGSPRRKEILTRMGLAYEVLVSEVSEEHEVLPGGCSFPTLAAKGRYCVLFSLS